MTGGVDARLALTYVFHDDRWVKKILIGAVWAFAWLAIVGIFVLVGYLVEIVRRVSGGSDEPLPEWGGNIGTYLRQGFPCALGVFIWLIPFQVVWLVLGLALDPVGTGGQLAYGLVMLVLANLYAAVVVPSVVIAFADNARFGAMSEFGSVVESARRIGTGFVAIWLVHLAVLALAFVTIWTIVAIMFTIAYATMVFGHAYGQAARIT